MVQKLVVGNWKMNGATADNASLIAALLQGIAQANPQDKVLVAVAPPSVYLSQVSQQLAVNAGIALAAQDVSAHAVGAFTGDVSASMLKEVGARYVIVGHSERRKYQQESDLTVALKAVAAQQAGLVPIVCVGETLDERDAGRALDVVQSQLQAVLDQSGVVVESGAFVLAYEPVWAIGTGRTATPEQAQEVHAALRRVLKSVVGEQGELVSVLYGGSMNASNAADLLAQPDIDGGLIGGAALKAPDFLAIVAAATAAA